MALNLQLLVLLGCIIVTVYCQNLHRSPLRFNSRIRRDAMSKSNLDQDDEVDVGKQFKNHLYNGGHDGNFRNVEDDDIRVASYKPKIEANRRSYEKNLEMDQVLNKRYSQPIFEEEEHAHPKYNYKYTVHDIEHLDVKHHQEERDGEHTVGEYSLLQPDGTILTVKYTVHGDEGFNAIVSKSEPVKEFEHHFNSHKNHILV